MKKSPRYSTDLVVFDLEATADAQDTNQIAASSIIEIAAVKLDRRSLATLGEFSELVRPLERRVAPHIAELTGITQAMVEAADPFDQVAQRFIEWYGPRNKAMLVAFGAYYDVPLLRKECQTFGIDFRSHFVGAALDVRSLAVAWLAARHLPTSGITLPRALKKLDIDLPDTRHHRALADATATAALLRAVHAA